jgi:hypothetical protein
MALAFALIGSGCASIGPAAISRDRVDYHEVLASSWKAQTLLNLVRGRYADPPMLLDISSIVNSYSWEAGATLGTNFGPDADQSTNLGLRGTYVDRPTISYSPVMGEKFTKSIMTPLSPASILSMVQAGYPLDAIFRVCVRSVNGVTNQVGAYLLRRPADPSFLPLIEAMRRIQTSGAFGLRVEKGAAGEITYLLLRRPGQEAADADMQLVARTLGLKLDTEYRLVYGVFPRNDGEIALLTRSMLEVMLELSAYIEVPERDVAESRTTPPPAFEAPSGANSPPPIRVLHGESPPADAYAAVRYRNRWWWIDDRDSPSKRLFGFLMILFSLAETGAPMNLPVLTIPAG